MPKTAYRPDPKIAALAAREGEASPFFDPVKPARFPDAILRYRNNRWAHAVGLGALGDAAWIDHFARFKPLENNLREPLALRYHGHQFRAYNPDIGDGRGFLFAQLRDGQDRLLDLGTKGSGLTPYSRTADGRLTLKGGVREVLATEMLEALGVYTSKTFSIIETGEALIRQDEPSPTRSCVLVRLGHGHIRFGAFQRLAYEGDSASISRLADYCIEVFDPDLAGLDEAIRTEQWFARVVARTARLAGQWMAAGFVHGVLNTDNMNVAGESFDYGPWRFLPYTDFSFTAAYFDQTGLYAFGRQPDAALWNLSRFGGTLVSLVAEDRLNAVLQTFPALFERTMIEAFFRRLGIAPSGEKDFEFIVALLQWMENTGIAFERLFFDWFCGKASVLRAGASPNAKLYEGSDFATLRERLHSFDPVRPERLAHPYFAGEPTTMLIDEVEAIWSPIAQSDDWSAFDARLASIDMMRTALGFDASAWRPSPNF
ncbi:MAG: YdiU family protein [Parvularculaceae bacterium]|nr:YdiU family protein [Parvularculaceae bacterium]